MAAPTVDTVIRGGQVVTASEAYEASIAIRGDKIVAVGPDDLLPPAANDIDATGKYVLPGAIDCHVHLGGHDDYHVGGIAAAHAGLTTIIPFATYDLARRETLPQAIKRHNEEVGKVSVVDFAWHFILNNDPYIFDGLPEALNMGVSSYKMFMT
jgi:dihydropyrimidinase